MPVKEILFGNYKDSNNISYKLLLIFQFWIYFIITLAFMPLLITILKQFSESIKDRQYLRQNENNKFNEKCLTLKDLSKKIVNEYSTVFTAMFASQSKSIKMLNY